LVLEHLDVERAIHRLQLILLVFHVNLVEEAIRVKVIMATCFPQVEVGDVRAIDELIARAQMHIFPEVLDAVANRGSTGMPQN
jgi:hypothetical protein